MLIVCPGPVKLGDLDFAGYTVSNQAYCECMCT